MTAFIILNSAEADRVRGPTTPPAALDPIERQGSTFILPVAVLSDPAHAMHHAFLEALPTLTPDDPAFPAAIDWE